MQIELDFTNTLYAIFTGYTSDGFSIEQLRMHIDGFTMATPLDTVKTNITLGMTVTESMSSPVIGEYFGVGWECINAAFLLGGLVLLYKKAIHWATPFSFLASLFICSLSRFYFKSLIAVLLPCSIGLMVPVC